MNDDRCAIDAIQDTSCHAQLFLTWQRTKRWRISGGECDRAVMSARRSDVQDSSPSAAHAPQQSLPGCEPFVWGCGAVLQRRLGRYAGWRQLLHHAQKKEKWTQQDRNSNRSPVCSVLFCVFENCVCVGWGRRRLSGRTGSFNTAYCPMEQELVKTNTPAAVLPNIRTIKSLLRMLEIGPEGEIGRRHDIAINIIIAAKD